MTNSTRSHFVNFRTYQTWRENGKINKEIEEREKKFEELLLGLGDS